LLNAVQQPLGQLLPLQTQVCETLHTCPPTQLEPALHWQTPLMHEGLGWPHPPHPAPPVPHWLLVCEA
jgi:hypothetical protein